MTIAELTTLVETSLSDMKAQDIKILDVRELTDIADTMIICSATSNRHVHSIADHVSTQAKAHDWPPIGVEGEDTNEWVLIDLSDVVVHIMLPKVREFYSLEQLWTATEKYRQNDT